MISFFQSRGTEVETVTVGEGNELSVFDLLETYEREQKWVVIDKLHLGTDKLLTDIKYRLQRLIKPHAGL